MALTQPELDRIRQELGVPLTRIGAEPYITWQAVFARAIAPYLIDTGSTSTTSVVAASGGASVPVTVAANPNAPDFAAPVFVPGCEVVVDMGPPQEVATIQSVAGLVLTLTLSNAHSGTYSVVPKGAEWNVRQILSRLETIRVQLSNIAPLQAGVVQVDEIKLSEGTRKGAGPRNMADELVSQRMQAREELSSSLGVPNLWRQRAMTQSSSRVELY